MFNRITATIILIAFFAPLVNAQDAFALRPPEAVEASAAGDIKTDLDTVDIKVFTPSIMTAASGPEEPSRRGVIRALVPHPVEAQPVPENPISRREAVGALLLGGARLFTGRLQLSEVSLSKLSTPALRALSCFVLNLADLTAEIDDIGPGERISFASLGKQSEMLRQLAYSASSWEETAVGLREEVGPELTNQLAAYVKSAQDAYLNAVERHASAFSGNYTYEDLALLRSAIDREDYEAHSAVCNFIHNLRRQFPGIKIDAQRELQLARETGLASIEDKYGYFRSRAEELCMPRIRAYIRYVQRDLKNRLGVDFVSLDEGVALDMLENAAPHSIRDTYSKEKFLELLRIRGMHYDAWDHFKRKMVAVSKRMESHGLSACYSEDSADNEWARNCFRDWVSNPDGWEEGFYRYYLESFFGDSIREGDGDMRYLPSQVRKNMLQKIQGIPTEDLEAAVKGREAFLGALLEEEAEISGNPVISPVANLVSMVLLLLEKTDVYIRVLTDDEGGLRMLWWHTPFENGRAPASLVKSLNRQFKPLDQPRRYYALHLNSNVPVEYAGDILCNYRQSECKYTVLVDSVWRIGPATGAAIVPTHNAAIVRTDADAGASGEQAKRPVVIITDNASSGAGVLQAISELGSGFDISVKTVPLDIDIHILEFILNEFKNLDYRIVVKTDSRKLEYKIRGIINSFHAQALYIRSGDPKLWRQRFSQM